MPAEPHLQTYQVAPPFQLCSLISDALDLHKLGSIPNNISQQGAVTDASNGVAHEFRCGVFRLQHPHRLVGEYVDGLHSGVQCRM